MSTIYKFDGKIHIKQIEHMYEKIKSIFKEDRHIRKNIQFMKDRMGKEKAELVLQLNHSIVHIDGKKETDTSVLIFDVEEDGYISSIGRWGKQNPYLMNQFIHLIEYFTKVKIWDEYDLLDIENWIGLNDEHFEDSLDMVS
jgi:phenylpyruvate tautomerase PptA (4-oxalocrotonate tautomerase family)